MKAPLLVLVIMTEIPLGGKESGESLLIAIYESFPEFTHMHEQLLKAFLTRDNSLVLYLHLLTRRG